MTKVFLGSILTALAFVAIPIVTGMNGGQEVDPAAVFKTFVTIVGAVVAFGLGNDIGHRIAQEYADDRRQKCDPE